MTHTDQWRPLFWSIQHPGPPLQCGAEHCKMEKWWLTRPSSGHRPPERPVKINQIFLKTLCNEYVRVQSIWSVADEGKKFSPRHPLIFPKSEPSHPLGHPVFQIFQTVN